MSHTRRSSLSSGTAVSVVLKNDQGTGLLTRGIVRDILTNSMNHPRGIKVRLDSGQVGRVAQIHSAIATVSENAVMNNEHEGLDAYPDLYGSDGHSHPSPPPARANQLSDWLPDLSNNRKRFHQESKGVPTIPPEESHSYQHEQEEKPWSCPVCTFLNNAALRQCEMCETPC